MAELGLDLKGGAKLVAAELYGDWFRDPWSWPELSEDFVSSLSVQEDLGITKKTDGFHLSTAPFFHLIDVPKSRLGTRPAVIFDPIARISYLSAVSANIGALHGSLSEWVYGWRTRDGNSLATGSAEWDAYVQDLPTPDVAGFGLLTDLTSFFASISSARLGTLVRDRLGKTCATNIIMDVVEAHDSLSSRSGLPQRSFGSAVLAHLFAQPIDDALAAALATDQGISRVRRWMDDVSAEGDEDALFNLLTALQRSARSIGLELNASKTHLAEAAQTATTLRLEDLKSISVGQKLVGGGDYESPMAVPDLDFLLSLENELLNNPRHVTRTVGRAILVSLTDHSSFDRLPEWLSIGHLIPHLADNLGRFIRGAISASPDHFDQATRWFVEYSKSSWAQTAWSVGQLALAFPSRLGPSPVDKVYDSWLRTQSSLILLSIAAQRTATRNPGLCRTIINGRRDEIADPLVQRCFALALLNAGEDRDSVRSLLTRSPTNGLLLRKLEQENWAPPTISNDFDPPAA